MRTLKNGVAQVVVLALLLGSFAKIAHTQEQITPWFEHQYGSAEVVVHSQQDGEAQLLFDGFLRFSVPHQFQVAFGTTGGLVLISSFEDFLEIQTKDDYQYGFDKHWLVDYFEKYFLSLVEFSQGPLEYSGSTQIADRHVYRYVDQREPGLTLWLDQETMIPLLVRNGQKTLLTVESYSQQLSSKEVELELALLYLPQPAKLTLSLVEGTWKPKSLEITSPQEEIVIKFSNWNFEYDWVPESPTGKLEKLKELNERFLVEYEDSRWSDALLTAQEMLFLSPHYWQVYLYQAFVYEGLGNFWGSVENYQQVIMREPTNALALNNLAYHYFLKEVQIVQGLSLAEQAVELERKSAYLDTLGYGYYLVGRFEEALELLEEAIETADEASLPEINSHRDLVLDALGRNTD